MQPELDAFLNWAAKNRFAGPGLEIKKVNVAPKAVTALSPQQARGLFPAASR